MTIVSDALTDMALKMNNLVTALTEYEAMLTFAQKHPDAISPRIARVLKRKYMETLVQLQEGLDEQDWPMTVMFPEGTKLERQRWIDFELRKFDQQYAELEDGVMKAFEARKQASVRPQEGLDILPDAASSDEGAQEQPTRLWTVLPYLFGHSSKPERERQRLIAIESRQARRMQFSIWMMKREDQREAKKLKQLAKQQQRREEVRLRMAQKEAQQEAPGGHFQPKGLAALQGLAERLVGYCTVR